MSKFHELMSGAAQGLGDVTRAGFEDVQNHAMQSLFGQPAPATSLTADMVTSSPMQDEPLSSEAALRQYTDQEQTEIRAGYEAGQGATLEPSPTISPSPAPEVASYEPPEP